MRHSILFAALIAAPLAARTPEKVMCSLNGAKAAPCKMTIATLPDGDHVLTFTAGTRRIRVSGSSQSGWWSGSLDGKPAMGLEMNRGYTRFSTTDLGTTFEWYYPGQRHGTY